MRIFIVDEGDVLSCKSPDTLVHAFAFVEVCGCKKWADHTFKWALSSRQVFRWLQDTVPETLTDIQRAARFYYLQQNCFGGKLESQTFGTATTAPPGLNLLRLEENLSAAHLRLSSTYIEQLDWRACVDKYDRPHTLFYLDPPYFETQGYGVPFPYSEYVEMASRLRSLK
ncbi:DNA adenine methylase [Paraburkholderia megapolitana]|uniref:DNA adenine methylase n=1 Tax=Paraburkholderia megapolitana TaxID=420953 RepID=A0A1I3U638_9BURK|nr:DNA adenine methylase [Paraburkholderia megapolitana]